MDGDEDARRRARAGGTLASAVELRTDGTARGARDRCVFARVDEGGTSVRWGEARGAADETRMNRMCAFANVSRVERRGDGLVVRLMKRDGDVVELTGRDVGEAAFGAPGRNFITWVLYTELIGTCALFFILEGDHLEILFDHAHTQEWFMCAAAAVMIPTLWLADLSSLAFIGGLGACASLSLVGVVLYELVAVGGFPTTLPPALSTTALVHLGTLPVSFGLLAFVFAGHAVFPAIYTSMRAPEEYEEARPSLAEQRCMDRARLFFSKKEYRSILSKH